MKMPTASKFAPDVKGEIPFGLEGAKMIETPKNDEMNNLLGQEKFAIWENLCTVINNKYDINVAWNNGGKAWKYEYKFSKGGKTLCGLYAREDFAGFMIIFGAAEREKVEEIRYELGEKTMAVYDEAKIYRDGKWVMFPLVEELIGDYMRLLAIKRKPNRD